MNVLELLHQELKDKNLTTEEKAYYLYIRSCQLFSFDTRYAYWELLKDGHLFKRKICNREIDLENVDDFRVVCSSYTSYVYSELLKQLLDIDSMEVGL